MSERTGDSATAKHILVPITRTEESETAILILADSTENLAEDLTLEEVGRIMGFDVETSELNDAFPFLPGVGTASDGADWAFEEAEPGDVSEVFENDQAFYALELVSSTPGGVTPLDQAQGTIRTLLMLEKKLTVGTAEGQRLVERVKSGVTLSDAAAEMDLQVSAPGPFTRQDFVPVLGQRNAAIGGCVRSCDRQRKRPRPHSGECLRDGEGGADPGRLDPVDGAETGATASTHRTHTATAPPGLDPGFEDRSQNCRPARRGAPAPG